MPAEGITVASSSPALRRTPASPRWIASVIVAIVSSLVDGRTGVVRHRTPCGAALIGTILARTLRRRCRSHALRAARRAPPKALHAV